MATTATKPVRKSTVKSADKKQTPTVKVAKPAAKPSREQDSVTTTMQRGKRDRKTRVIEPSEPTGNGGVRFEEIADKGRSPHYLTQADDAELGKPQKIRVTVKAL